jgi:isopenicillin N synthase-like dioxygenase
MASTMNDVQIHELNDIGKLMSNGINHLQVQDKYILPPSERPRMSEISYCEGLPVVDLKDLDGPYRSRVVQEIGRACEEGGFFQIVNHGVPDMVMKNMMGIAKEFFEMPVEDRAYLYSEDRKQRVRLSTSFDVLNEKVHNWMDYLTQPCHPVEEVMDSWPVKPAAYREIAGKYVVELRALCLKLLTAISEALALDSDYLNRVFGNFDQMMGINYYPPCPNPDLTIGLAGHSDSGAITVLMQGDVSGLQVQKNEKWVAVEPIPNAFVVNLGDQVQVVSNGRFKSVEHRAVTNASTARISIPTFCIPVMDSFIAPAASMVDEQHQPLYRGYKFEEFWKVFRSKGLTTNLDHFKIEYPENASH